MPFNQRLADLAPDDPTWRNAPPALRLAFHRKAGEVAVEVKRGELSRGIGANGRRMAPRKRPRADGANGPVLLPHRADSRTVRLLAAHSDPSGITLFWRSGHSRAQRLSWGTVLGFHAAGQVKGAPVRDVRLSKRGVGLVRERMRRWWATEHAGRIRREAAERQAAAERERRSERARRPKVAKVAARAVDAMAKRYAALAEYLKPHRGGF